jgi:hypothetical protein
MKGLCKAEMIPQLPHMRVYAAHKKRSPYTKQWYKDYEVYSEIPQARQISMALTSQLVDSGIKRIRSMQDWDNWAVDELVVPQARSSRLSFACYNLSDAFSPHVDRVLDTCVACISWKALVTT